MSNRIAQTAEVRTVKRDERTIDVIASTFAIDSYRTRIDPNGWDLEQFRKNPVITWAHDDRGFTASGGRPIAKAENIRVEDGKLKMTLRFPSAGKFQFADEVFNLMADGFLNAVSVGFEALEHEDRDEGDEKVRVYTRAKLLELAVVTIPSNDEALVTDRAMRMKADPEEVRARVEKVEKLAMESIHSEEDVEKWKRYFENKQPANRASTKVMEQFYKRILKEDQPENEVKAWERMGEAIEAMEASEEPTEIEPVEPIEEVTAAIEETPVATPEEPTPPTPEPVEAPQEARKASVRIPHSVLLEFPEKLRKSYVDAAVEALQRGIPIKDACNLIDGMNNAVTSSIPHS